MKRLIEDIKSGVMDETDLLEYVTSNDIEVAISVAESEYATEPILDIAAHDRDKRVRIAAVNNPNTEKETLKYLLNDSVDEIATIANNRLERS